MSIDEFYNLSNAEKVEVAIKIARTTFMSYAEVSNRLFHVCRVYRVFHEIPFELLNERPAMAQILVELDRIKE